MESVFLLWHVHELPDGGDEKLIGGFRETPDGFMFDNYRLNEDHWTEGYATVD